MASEQKIDARKKTPPYLPFRTFLSSLDVFSQGLPDVLDRTIWRSQAGVTQGLIMNAYRFFGLVDEYDSPTDALSAVVRQTEGRPQIFRGLIEATYGREFGHDFSTTTPRLLEDQFVESYAVTGATKQKAITFFLKAAQFSSITLSPFLLNQIRNTSTRKRKARAKESPVTKENGIVNGSMNTPLNNATTHKITLASGGTLTVAITANPFKMPQKDREFVFSLIDKLQDYENAHSSEDTEDEEDNEQ